MRKLFYWVVFLLPSTHLAQREFDLWTSASLEVPYKDAWKFGLTSEMRLNQYQLPSTFFQEVSASYEVSKLLKVSVDYRLVQKANEFDNFPVNHRFNFNVHLKQKFEWGSIQFRTRYQTGFSANQFASAYSPEFDNAWRFRPGIEWKFSKKLKPYSNLEWFYNMENKPLGRRFTRTRFALGTEINLKGPHSLDVKYIFGFSTNLPTWKREHILSLSYAYEWKKSKKGKKTDKKGKVNEVNPVLLFADYPISVR